VTEAVQDQGTEAEKLQEKVEEIVMEKAAKAVQIKSEQAANRTANRGNEGRPLETDNCIRAVSPAQLGFHTTDARSEASIPAPGRIPYARLRQSPLQYAGVRQRAYKKIGRDRCVGAGL
jgi:hypothetical protein